MTCFVQHCPAKARFTVFGATTLRSSSRPWANCCGSHLEQGIQEVEKAQLVTDTITVERRL